MVDWGLELPGRASFISKCQSHPLQEYFKNRTIESKKIRTALPCQQEFCTCGVATHKNVEITGRIQKHKQTIFFDFKKLSGTE